MQATQWTVLATARGFDPAAKAFLEAQGCCVRHPALGNADPTADSLPGLLAGVDAWIAGGTDIGRDLMIAFPQLQIIARRGVGFEQIDIQAANALGRVVTIAAGGNAASVADHTIGLMLAVSKQMVPFTNAMRAGDWTYRVGHEIYQRTVGIVGLGRIGRGVAARLAGFEARVLAVDITPIAARYAAEHGIQMVDLPTLLREADVVTLHAPLDVSTRAMIDAAALRLMKRDAILLNTARGGLVDEPALLAALQTGEIAGAGLDVFEAEKDPAHSATAAALVALPNVVATPHTAAATREGLVRTNMIAARTSRRGNFWLPGQRIAVGDEHFQRGPLYVEWEAPAQDTDKLPIVLVHGGATQGTEWLDTPDGRPGWAQRLVEAGYPVLVVDRPTQGRSPFHPAVAGDMGAAFSYEEGRTVFFPPSHAEQHTQWPVEQDDEAAVGAFIAQFGPLPRDLEASQAMDADRIAELLDRVGPAIIITHSASGADGWLVADRRPDLVAAIVSVEPMGPPFADVPNIGRLAWGVSAAPLTFDPSPASPDELESAPPESRHLPALDGIPVAVVTGGASPFAAAGAATVAFLVAGGASVEHIDLPDHGIFGNGHGLIYERNSDEALVPVVTWLERHATRVT